MNKWQKWFIDAFPAPKYLTMPAAAIDISPNSVKYLEGVYTAKGCLPQEFDEVFLPEGVIKDGAVQDEDALTEALLQLKQKYNRKFVAVSIPENALYLYTMRIDRELSHSAIKQQIEFSFSEYVPISLDEAVYDFDLVGALGNTVIISVTVAPVETIATYERIIINAGFSVRSIELEAYAIARAVTAHSNIDKVEMVVDIGYERTGIIIAKKIFISIL